MVSVSKPNETRWFRFRPKPPGFAKPTNETIFKPKTTFFKDSEIILSFYLTNLAKKRRNIYIFFFITVHCSLPKLSRKNWSRKHSYKLGVSFGFGFGFGFPKPIGFRFRFRPKPKKRFRSITKLNTYIQYFEIKLILSINVRIIFVTTLTFFPTYNCNLFIGTLVRHVWYQWSTRIPFAWSLTCNLQ